MTRSGWRRGDRLPRGGGIQPGSLDPALRGGDVGFVDLDADEPPAHLDRGDARRPDAHERVQDEVARTARQLQEPAQDAQRLLGRVDRVADALVAAADRRLDEVVHVALAGEVPGVAAVPAADDQVARGQEARATELAL